MTKHYLKYDGGRSREYEGHKIQKYTGDCAIRAIAIGLGQPYKTTTRELCDLAIEMGSLPNEKSVYEAYLYSKDYKKHKEPKYEDGTKYKVKELRPRNCIACVRVRMDCHMTTVVDNTVKDTWDTRNCYVLNYYTKTKTN